MAFVVLKLWMCLDPFCSFVFNFIWSLLSDIKWYSIFDCLVMDMSVSLSGSISTEVWTRPSSRSIEWFEIQHIDSHKCLPLLFRLLTFVHLFIIILIHNARYQSIWIIEYFSYSSFYFICCTDLFGGLLETRVYKYSAFFKFKFNPLNLLEHGTGDRDTWNSTWSMFIVIKQKWQNGQMEFEFRFS